MFIGESRVNHGQPFQHLIAAKLQKIQIASQPPIDFKQSVFVRQECQTVPGCM